MLSQATMTSQTPKLFAREDERWDAVRQRDHAADGAFFYSVATTGVYCRPSCAARLPRRENVQFHATCADAEHAGFRPCKRCRPNEPGLQERHSLVVAKACRAIEAADDMPDLDTLANATSQKGVCMIQLGDDADTLVHDLRDRFPNARLVGRDRPFEKLIAKVVALVETPAASLELPLDVRGTAFQRRVWQKLREIPAGS